MLLPEPQAVLVKAEPNKKVYLPKPLDSRLLRSTIVALRNQQTSGVITNCYVQSLLLPLRKLS
jgi:hypothetical protein